MEPDFSGYVTKYGVRCSDGRTILAHAFKGQDKQQIPLVWAHQHDDPTNVLGHLVLEHRDDGVYADAFFNETPSGVQAKGLVTHKDINALSIYANQLVQKGKNVIHGLIREGSLVLAGANPGAFIDNINLQHGDGTVDVLEDEVIIYSGEELVHAASTTVTPPKKVSSVPAKGKMPQPSGDSEPSGGKKPTADNPDPDNDGDNDLFDKKDGGLGPDASVEEVLNTLTPEQKKVVYGLVGQAVKHSANNSHTSTDDPKGEPEVTRNVFDQTDDNTKKSAGATLSHSDQQAIFASARKNGSLKDAVEEYAIAHGIDSIDTLFPYDQAVTDTPEFISRRMEWVAGVLAGVRKTPFSRIRSWSADITQDEARAKGYIKGNMKKEEFFAVARRITTPQTIYKKQRLDRDDILDITDFDVVQWLQTEMRVMLDEELARAILVGDGREVDDPDKINPVNVRPILGDDEMYTTVINVDAADINAATLNAADTIVDAVVTGMRFYRGSGNPVMYTTLPWLSKMLLAKDTLGRRLYATKAELSSALGVSNVVACEALEANVGLIGIIVNLSDYTVGADKGGDVSMFDFFDIDYNQFKYLMETRVSGAMTKYKGALTVMEFSGAGGVLADPPAPTFDEATGVGTIPSASNVTYVTVASDGTESAALTSGAQTAVSSGTTVHYRAKAASTYTFADGASEDWTFTRS